MTEPIPEAQPEAPSIPEGYMEDAKGRLIREAQVKPQDKLVDQTVKSILGFAKDLNAQIARFKGHTFDDVYTTVDLLAEQYGAKKGGTRGNIQLTSFDGLSQVRVQIQDYIEFGPELQVAKSLIDECIGDWAEGSRDEIRALVNHTFNVDKPGQVNREALFSLRRIEIDDERWKQAVTAIADSIRTTGSKAQVRFYTRKTLAEKFEAVTVNLAAA